MVCVRDLNSNPRLLEMVRETNLRVEDLIYPLFVMEGEGKQEEGESIPWVRYVQANAPAKLWNPDN